MPALSEFVSVKRRYSRSVNLERDLGVPESLTGYIPTSRAIDSIERFLRSVTLSSAVRAWTLTGSYGTGKSAFANFLTAISACREDENHLGAIEILKQTGYPSPLRKQIESRLPASGLVRAVATAQREPIVKTVIRALHAGATLYWQNARGRRPHALDELSALFLKSLDCPAIDNDSVIHAIQSLAQASKTGILLIIDELGKNLEFSAQNQSMDDLYLLQQIAELAYNRDGFNVFFFGILHQSFIDYAHGLASAQRNEWAKIQGRFEDIPFIESPDRMMRLIGQAIDQSTETSFTSYADSWAEKWEVEFADDEMCHYFNRADLVSIYPLHPLSALILPILCTKYSQNDRTLFTFLASGEPDSFSTFLSQTVFSDESLPSFKLHQIYDYFVGSANISISARPQSQRWVEIQARLSDASHLHPDALLVLKTIGLLNLVSTTGSLRASRRMVALAMSDHPDDSDDLQYWHDKIEELLAKGFLIWRRRIDELRIWEGSDFDIEKELSERGEIRNRSLAELLNEYSSLGPLVIQKHSYQTGTLRYFERRYYDSRGSIESAECERKDSDGLICYWLGNTGTMELEGVPKRTSDGRPILVLCASHLSTLKTACYEFVSLLAIKKNAKQLQTDGVARREVGHRILCARRLLNDSLSMSFASPGIVNFYGPDGKMAFKSWRSFQTYLSHLCDNIYHLGPRIWNELINRRELTAQGASARNKLISAMLENGGQPRLGIVGNGPEYSMFESVLRRTGIYVESEGIWIFARPPESDDGIHHVWKAIEDFCKESKSGPRNIGYLYDLLEAPPYGVKKGIIPVLLLAVLLYHNEYVSVYADGSFVPVLGPEHFELLVKKPERFAVKFFELSGVRAEVFHELGRIISSDRSNTDAKVRNRTILSIVRPLVGFARRLPQFTLTTEDRLPLEALAVRKALLAAREPDELLFSALPKACGFPIVTGDADEDKILVKSFGKKLVQALTSLQVAYDDLLGECERLIRRSFAIKIDTAEFRDNLRYRALNLASQVIEPRLKGFLKACCDAAADKRSWIESLLLMISGKPPKSWTDEDVIIFETKLSDVARRFMNLEALQKEMAIPNEGIDARRITVTYPDGEEIHQMLWIDREKQANIEQMADRIIDKYRLNDDANVQQALATALIEKMFRKRSETANSNPEQLKKERKIASR